jgi:hydrogenase maturation protease
MRTRLIGLGNDLLSDDGVGLEVVRILRKRLGNRPDLEFRETPAGGIRLLDEVLGADRVVLIDALMSPDLRPGTLGLWWWNRKRGDFVPCDVRDGKIARRPGPCHARRYSSTHDTDLASALQLAKRFGMQLPRRIWLYGVAIQDGVTFHTGLSPEVAQGRDTVVELLCRSFRTEG